MPPFERMVAQQSEQRRDDRRDPEDLDPLQILVLVVGDVENEAVPDDRVDLILGVKGHPGQAQRIRGGHTTRYLRAREAIFSPPGHARPLLCARCHIPLNPGANL